VAHKWFNEQGELQEYEEPFEDPNQLKLFNHEQPNLRRDFL
jgi:hypothetical protein